MGRVSPPYITRTPSLGTAVARISVAVYADRIVVTELGGEWSEHTDASAAGIEVARRIAAAMPQPEGDAS